MKPEKIKAAAKAMLIDMTQMKFESGLVWIEKNSRRERRCLSSNPTWYRQLCSRWMSKRKRYPKLRTFIKRQHAIKALKDLAGLPNEETEASRLLDNMLGRQYIQRLMTSIEEELERHEAEPD